MKKKNYWVVIVLIVLSLIGIIYLTTLISPPQVRGAATTHHPFPTAHKKNINIESAICSGSPDTIKFILRHRGTLDIETGELAAFLDTDYDDIWGEDGEFINYITTTPDIMNYSLKVGSVSPEFSYSAPEDKATRILMVCAPARCVNETLECS